MMTIKEFADNNQIDISAIYRKIKRNEKRLEGHIRVVNGVINIDEIAETFLLPRNKAITQRAEFEKTELEEKYEILISAYKGKIENLISEKSELEQEVQKLRQALEQREAEIDLLNTQKSYFSKNSKSIKKVMKFLTSD
ncbi:MAG: hypothetical protein IJY83_04630 [Oscillospiraceae bacterium]|nr:hypothetical protein [Oscillospiraceae bacterium]